MALPARPAISATPPVARQADAGRMAAQKAFFQAALAKPQPAAQAAPTAQPATAQARTAAPSQPPPAAPRTAELPEEPPKKILRPGSFIDIRV